MDKQDSLSRDPNQDFIVFVVMALSFLVPTLLTMHTIHVARDFVPPTGSSPYGYTWSLTLFIIPIASLGWWLARRIEMHVERRAFWFTVAAFFTGGYLLDTFLANTIFTFKNPGAVLGIYLWGYDFTEGWLQNIPIEEFAFYLFGVIFMLLIYIWSARFWFGGEVLEDFRDRAIGIDKLVKPHWLSALLGLGVIALGLVYKKYFSPYPDGFPTYFVVLVIGFVMPTFVFFYTVKPLVNWRALTLTYFLLQFVSLLWEATLGVPYQWWGYEPNQMLGIFFGAWTNLPFEATFLWLVAAWGTVMVYEVSRIWLYQRQGAAHVTATVRAPDRPTATDGG